MHDGQIILLTVVTLGGATDFDFSIIVYQTNYDLPTNRLTLRIFYLISMNVQLFTYELYHSMWQLIC